MTKNASGKKSAPGTPIASEGVIKGSFSKGSPRANGSSMDSRGEESPEKKQRTMDYEEMTVQFKHLAAELSSNIITTIDQHMTAHAQNQTLRMEQFEKTITEKIAGQDSKFVQIAQKMEEKEKKDEELKQRLEQLQKDIENSKKDELMADQGPGGQPAPGTPAWRPRFSASGLNRGSPTPSVASVASEGGVITEAVNTTVCVGIKEETRRAEFEDIMKATINEVMPGTVPLAVYTIYKRASTGYIRFADAATMWQFIMRVKAKLPRQVINWVAPRKTAVQIRSDKPMNAFLRTLYATPGAPPKEQIEAEYKLGKVWFGRHLVAQGLRQDEEMIISDAPLRGSCPELDLPSFINAVTAAVRTARAE
jgi:hypothetical protein